MLGYPLCSEAQLSEPAIIEITARQVDRWANYLNLSEYRQTELRKVWKKHEQKKSAILHSTENLKIRLEKEKLRFKSELRSVFTANELRFYIMLEELEMKDDRAYLESLVKAVSDDSLFIAAYTDLQYSKVFPFNMAVRVELEKSLTRSDEILLDSIRTEILGLYDKCLLTCLITGHHENDLFGDVDKLLIVELNKNLDDKQSGISKLVELTHKYEDSIHDLFFKHKDKYDYWTKITKELKDQYILESYNKSIQEIRKKNNYATLKHLESEAIFLLLDPYDKHLSRKLFNLKLYNQL